MKARCLWCARIAGFLFRLARSRITIGFTHPEQRTPADTDAARTRTPADADAARTRTRQIESGRGRASDADAPRTRTCLGRGRASDADAPRTRTRLGRGRAADTDAPRPRACGQIGWSPTAAPKQRRTPADAGGTILVLLSILLIVARGALARSDFSHFRKYALFIALAIDPSPLAHSKLARRGARGGL